MCWSPNTRGRSARTCGRCSTPGRWRPRGASSPAPTPDGGDGRALVRGHRVPGAPAGRRHRPGGARGARHRRHRRLAGVRDVYGLQCHGISPGNEPDGTVEAMAARYVAAVPTAQPEGPYEVVGYSLGGLIAFEVARQLAAE